jgi:hypothetical protein
MRITYRTLGKLIAAMNEEQLDCDLTVEIPTEQLSECYSAELRIAGSEHDAGLDDGHPVIFVHCLSDRDEIRTSDIDEIKETIGL